MLQLAPQQWLYILEMINFVQVWLLVKHTN